MPSKVWGQITYPFPNFNRWSVEVWEWISNFIAHFIINVIIHPILGLKWFHVSKWGLWLWHIWRKGWHIDDKTWKRSPCHCNGMHPKDSPRKSFVMRKVIPCDGDVFKSYHLWYWLCVEYRHFSQYAFALLQKRIVSRKISEPWDRRDGGKFNKRIFFCGFDQCKWTPERDITLIHRSSFSQFTNGGGNWTPFLVQFWICRIVTYKILSCSYICNIWI